MASELCLSITFLDPAFHGRGDAAEPEWPPSPLRLFQAILAAAHAVRRPDGGLSDSMVSALRWLEQQDAPVIVTPDSRPGQPFRLSVPNNAMDVVAAAWGRGNETGKDANPATHRAMKLVEGTSLVDGDTIHYLWPLPEPVASPTRESAEQLCSLIQSVIAFGWGIDMVVGHGRIITVEESTAIPGERWEPTLRQSPTVLRSPVAGTLDAIQQRYSRFLQRIQSDGEFSPVPALTRFRLQAYLRDVDKPGRPFAAFQFQHPDEERFRAFRLTQVSKVSAMVRHAVATVAQETSHSEPGVTPEVWLDQYVHGHDRTNETRIGRFAYLPLASIDPRGVVGAIRRVLIAEPMDGDGQHSAWAFRMLAGQPLTNEKTQQNEAYLSPAHSSDSVIGRYVARSKDWATITPVVLPWGDSGKPQRAEKQLLKAMRHAGYNGDDLENLELRRESFWRCAELAREFFVPKHLQGTACWHVRLQWKHQVNGPVAIGSGRFYGLGLFAAFD